MDQIDKKSDLSEKESYDDKGVSHSSEKEKSTSFNNYYTQKRKENFKRAKELTSDMLLKIQKTSNQHRKRRSTDDLLLLAPLEVDRIQEDSLVIIYCDGQEKFVKAADRPEGGDSYILDWYTDEGECGYAKWSEKNKRWEEEIN